MSAEAERVGESKAWRIWARVVADILAMFLVAALLHWLGIHTDFATFVGVMALYEAHRARYALRAHLQAAKP